MQALFDLENNTSLDCELICSDGQTRLSRKSKIPVFAPRVTARCSMELSIDTERLVIHGNWERSTNRTLNIIQSDHPANDQENTVEYVLKNLGTELLIFEEPYGTQTSLRSGSTLRVFANADRPWPPNTIVIHQEKNWSGLAIWENSTDLTYEMDGVICEFSER